MKKFIALFMIILIFSVQAEDPFNLGWIRIFEGEEVTSFKIFKHENEVRIVMATTVKEEWHSHGMIHMLSKEGEILWSHRDSSPINTLDVGDLDGDLNEEIIYGNLSLVVLSFDGKEKFKFSKNEEIFDIEISDLDKDGTNEIIFATIKSLNLIE